MKAQKAKQKESKPASGIVIKEKGSNLPIEEEMDKARKSKGKNVPGATKAIISEDPQFEEMMKVVQDNLKVNQLTKGPRG